jgi:hypothetical protein
VNVWPKEYYCSGYGKVQSLEDVTNPKDGTNLTGGLNEHLIGFGTSGGWELVTSMVLNDLRIWKPV